MSTPAETKTPQSYSVIDSAASDEGAFLSSGDEEEFDIDDDVSDVDIDMLVPESTDEDSPADGDDKPTATDNDEVENNDEADWLKLLYVATSSEDMSKDDLRLHSRKVWELHQSSCPTPCIPC